LMLAFVLALGVLGVGYAKWSDTVSINGTVTTGNVCVNWVTDDLFDACGTGTRDYNVVLTSTPNSLSFHQVDKDVACVTVTPDFAGDVTQPPYVKKLTYTINNAYPMYGFVSQVQWCSCGTVPVVIENIRVITHGFTNSDVPWNPDINGPSPLWVSVTNGVGLQIDPVTIDGLQCLDASVKVVVQEAAVQNQSYTFDIIWDVSQWNESSVVPGPYDHLE
jgi:predicted ribosomally synthesized peptide with SipW-like signal peptide